MSPPESESNTPSGRFAYEGLDRVIHEKARLGILTSLATHAEGLPFADLKELCALTDGNLNRHLSVLADAGLVEIQKRQRERRQQTLCRLTDVGRERFLQYVAVLESVVSDAQRCMEPEARAGTVPSGAAASRPGLSTA